MFRNSQLLRRSNQVTGTEGESDSRPVAILANSNAVESGMIVPILNKFGFRVFEARDGAVGLDLAKAHDATLIIASADLPSISGAQLCQKVRERTGINTPFILISPEGALPDKFAGHETFASDYAPRPLNLEEFESRLKAVLRVHRTGVTANRSTREFPAPVPFPSVSPSPSNQPTFADVKDMGLAVAPMETETIDGLLTDSYLDKHDVRREGAELYKQAFLFINSAIQAAQKDEPLPMNAGFEIAVEIVKSMTGDRSLMMLATDRTSQFSFRQHSVNVAVLGTRIAQTLHLSAERQVRLCLAGMLHDLGSVKLPKKLISKHSGFSAAERAEMQRRPVYSAELASGYPGFEWLPKIVLQVYERENGSGYPHGIRSKDIFEEARILGVSDVFEACIHRRPQRAAMTGYRALEVITAEFDSFGERITKAMIRSFSVYPFNEIVVLNTGEIARVIDVSPDNPLRPVIRIVYTAERTEIEAPRVVDLSRNSQLWITNAITPDELPNGGK